MIDTPVIETERLILRRPVENDFLNEVDFWQSARAEFLGGMKSKNEVWRAFAMMEGHWAYRGYGFFAVTDKNTGEYFGRVGPWYPHGWPEQELGWTVMAAAEGKGIAYEAAMAVRDYAYEILGWETAISLIDPQNTRSMRLAERMGAINSGEKFDYVDAEDLLHIYRHPSPIVLAQEATQ